MKKILSTLTIVLFCAITFAQSNANLWSPIAESEIPDLGKRYIIPSKYQTLKLDIIQMRNSLLEAPLEKTPKAKTNPAFLEIPWPDGSIKTFRIVESPCMEKGLMEKFPEIKTYSGYEVGDQGKYMRLDLTPKGFHAMVLTSGEGTVYVDPYSFGGGDIEHYISYYKKDFTPIAGKKMVCGILFQIMI